MAYHAIEGWGSPTRRHSKMILLPSSDCLMTGRSVKVGLTPSAGRGAASPKRRKEPRRVAHFFHEVSDKMTLKEINPKSMWRAAGARENIIQLKKLSICLIPATAVCVWHCVLKIKDEILLSRGCLRPVASAAPKTQNHYMLNRLTRLAIYFLKLIYRTKTLDLQMACHSKLLVSVLKLSERTKTWFNCVLLKEK